MIRTEINKELERDRTERTKETKKRYKVGRQSKENKRKGNQEKTRLCMGCGVGEICVGNEKKEPKKKATNQLFVSNQSALNHTRPLSFVC